MALKLSSSLLLALRATTALSLVAVTAPAVMAQEITGTIRGEVTDDDGNPVPGATVTIVHTPSGTRSVLRADGSGNFSAANLRIGGPFNVLVEAPGFEAANATIPTIAAGQPQRITVFMVPEGQMIEVVAARTARSSIEIATGPATILTERDIQGVASINRDVRSLAARDPLVTLDPTNGTGAIQIAGQNNRFNRITVDGIAFGDPFGLEAGGLASARGPVPLDAIGEFTVEAAPVDIQQGNFQGGAVNTVLKSGGNDFRFTGFFSYTDDSLAGNKSRGQSIDQDFESKIWGLQATGPIIRDRLFFAVTYEQTDNTTPANVGIAGEGFLNEITEITRADITAVQNVSNSVYSFDPLDIASAVPESDKKLVVKVDWNISDRHRAAFTYIWNEGDILAGQTALNEVGAASPILSLQSNNYTQGSINHYGVVQLNSDWTDTFSTQVRVSYNDYERLQVPFNGREFGQFTVCLRPDATTGLTTCPTGTGRINFGPDISRQANELFVETLGVEFQARLRQNNHDVKFIAERRQQDFNNLFAQRVSGAWRFDSFDEFQNRTANELDLAVPIRGDIDTVRALFTNIAWTFGVQDTWEITPDLTFIYGFRYDLYESPDNPIFNPDFLGRFGFPNNSSLNGRGLLQPRFGLNWRATDRVRLRAAAGLYGGGNPNVWISNQYSNPGPTLARFQVRRNTDGTFAIAGIPGLSAAQVQALGAATLNNVSGGPGVPGELLALARGTGSAVAPTNALDPDFQLPSQWRISGSVDWRANLGFLGDDWRLGADVVWSSIRDSLVWTDLRSVPNAVQGTLPDGRPRYQSLTGDNNTDIFLTNGNRGYSWNVVARVAKDWDNGFSFGMSYSFQRVRDENPGTSSVAFSNYSNAAAEDPNFAAYGISNYQRDDSFRLRLGYEREFFGDNATRFDLFFNSLAGQRFSYTFQDRSPGQRRAIFGTTQRNDAYLLYVPNVSSITADPIVTYANEATFAAFRDFVLNSPLNKYQGQIAPKNIGQSPRFEKMDLRISQEIPFFLGGKIQLFADFENFLNMLNSDWGSLRQVSFPYLAPVVDVACPNPANPAQNITSTAQVCNQYRYSNFREPSLTNFVNISLWQVRLGVRLSF